MRLRCFIVYTVGVKSIKSCTNSQVTNCKDTYNHIFYLQNRVIHTHLYVAEGGEPHLSGHAPTGGQQWCPYSLQSCQTDCWETGTEAEEEAEGGGHDRGVRADQGGVQQRQDVEELIL